MNRTNSKISRMEIDHKRRVNDLIDANNALLERVRKAEDKLKELVEKPKHQWEKSLPCQHRWGIGRRPHSAFDKEQCYLCGVFHEDVETISPVKTYEDGYLEGYKQGVKDGCELMRDCKKIVTDTIARE